MVRTLRAAIQEANAGDDVPAVDDIAFAILGAGPHTIAPAALAVGTNAVLKIVIRGPAPPGSQGFDAERGPTTIRGLAINGFQEGSGYEGDGIVLFNVDGNTNNAVEGNVIGTNAAGTAAATR